MLPIEHRHIINVKVTTTFHSSASEKALIVSIINVTNVIEVVTDAAASIFSFASLHAYALKLLG